MQNLTSLRAAAKYAGVSHQTIKNWAREFGIGELVGSQWRVDREKLDAVLAARRQISEIKSDLRSAA